MSLEAERAAFRAALTAWGNGDLEGMLRYFADDIVDVINVDGAEVPYGASTEGKPAMRARLELLLATFDVNAFVVEQVVHEAEFCRAMVLGYYRHKATGERLDIKFRLRGLLREGLIVRLEEHYDEAYILAFQRFVTHLEAAARAKQG